MHSGWWGLPMKTNTWLDSRHTKIYSCEIFFCLIPLSISQCIVRNPNLLLISDTIEIHDKQNLNNDSRWSLALRRSMRHDLLKSSSKSSSTSCFVVTNSSSNVRFFTFISSHFNWAADKHVNATLNLGKTDEKKRMIFIHSNICIQLCFCTY